VFVADALCNEVEKNGFAICEEVLPPELITALLGSLSEISDYGSLQKRGTTFAIRNLLETSLEVRELANSEVVRRLVDAVLGPGCFAVRGILFDKIPDANWKVPWHQDVAIAVQEKVETKGFGPWSIKADVVHVQPPAFVLEQMISVRFHLDPCGEDNGALRVIPGSHLQGRIAEEEIAKIREETPERICAVRAGGALLMRPLLLHASSPSRVPGHRRVIHIDFATVELPNGMRWFSEKSRTSWA
jgi:ectoine hydroxylase-related dioxygenase (phytanoyl-CoA dioxygenase family)